MSDFPERLHLPSGTIVHLAEHLALATAQMVPRASLFAEALSLFEDHLRLEDDERRPISIGALRLDDFHVLRAIAHRVGLLSESPVSVACGNCEERFELLPSLAIELGPFVDGELHDPELDAPFPFGEPQSIPEIMLDDARMATVTLTLRTVDEARPLWEKLAGPSWQFDEHIVSALGICSLGDERQPSRIARALSDASDEAIDAILDYFDEAHYSLRLRPAVRCPLCGAVEYVDAPVEREFPTDEVSGDTFPDAPFLDLDAFEARVRAMADDVYRERGVTHAVNLVVHTSVPAIDEGGVPLLGSYLPGGPDPATGIMCAPEVTLYFRTFRAMWEEEGAYDVDREIRETIDHELEHHLHHLAGHDPLDDEERAAIDGELMRLVGRREATRRARAGFVADVSEFLVRTWPLWVLVLLLTVVATLAER